jgi:hypothetical protein
MMSVKLGRMRGTACQQSCDRTQLNHVCVNMCALLTAISTRV